MNYKNIEINWLGHAGFKIKTVEGKVIFIDPFKIPDESESADFIFITHSHYDHCSIDDIQKIAKTGTVVICPADVSSKLTHILAKIDIKIAEIGEKFEFELENKKKLKFWVVPAYNTNKSFHTREEDWVGYIISIDDVLIYHAGDTDLIPEMKTFSTANIDVALLPIGGTYTMNAGEAARAASIIKPKLAIPMHWGTLKGIGERKDAELFLKHCSAEGVSAKILEIENNK